MFYFRKQVQIHIIDLQNVMACYSKMVHVHLSMLTKKLLTLFYFRKQVQIHIIDLQNFMVCYSKAVYVHLSACYNFC
jgi:hypothetical protein